MMSGGPTTSVLGIDSSTQSTKVELRDLSSGQLVAVGRAAHPPTTPPNSEQDPEAWWLALTSALAQVGRHLPAVAALAVAGQQHGLVLLDQEGHSLRPAKLWNDTTSSPEAEELVKALGPAAWATRCGSVPTASFTITKLAWVASHEPEVLAATTSILLPHDYLTWRLSGAKVTDRGDASGTGWWSPSTGQYDQELLDLVAYDGSLPHRLPEVRGPLEAAGTTNSAAIELGFGSGVIVGPGTGDNMAGALGLGLVEGDVAISIGTSGTVYAVSGQSAHDPSGAVAGFADATGNYLPLVCTLNATKVTDAIARLLGVDHHELSALTLAADPGSGGIVMIPYFDGERTPNRPTATGTVVGLRSNVERPQLARAAHEGVVCGLLDGLDALRAAGVATTGRLFLIGGGAKSPAYRQIVADLAATPLIVPQAEETVATGACVQAAAVLEEVIPTEIARRWGLGRGEPVDPGPVDSQAIRQAYAAAAVR